MRSVRSAFPAKDLKQQMLGKQGLESTPAGAADLARLLRDDIGTYQQVFKAANIKME